MAKRGSPALGYIDILEIRDLYRWGMQVWMICAFYDIHKETLRSYIKEMQRLNMVKQRKSVGKKSFRSSRRRIRGAVDVPPDPFEDAYLIVREHARVLRDTRTAPRREDESIRSYRAAVSELQHAFEHNDSLPLGPGLPSDTAPCRRVTRRTHRTVSAASLPPRASACRDR